MPLKLKGLWNDIHNPITGPVAGWWCKPAVGLCVDVTLAITVGQRWIAYLHKNDSGVYRVRSLPCSHQQHAVCIPPRLQLSGLVYSDGNESVWFRVHQRGRIVFLSSACSTKSLPPVTFFDFELKDLVMSGGGVCGKTGQILTSSGALPMAVQWGNAASVLGTTKMQTHFFSFLIETVSVVCLFLIIKPFSLKTWLELCYLELHYL